MRRLFIKLHLWLGISAGMIILIMCVTGSILVFEQEILELVYPQRYRVEVKPEGRLNLDYIVANAELVLKDTIKTIQVQADTSRTYVATTIGNARTNLYIDPYTAEITGSYNQNEGFFAFVEHLHRWLVFEPRGVGRTITGTATICMALILISGFLIWLPKRSKHLIDYFRIKRKISFARSLFDLHRVFGFYACGVLLACCLTGLVWSFKWYPELLAPMFNLDLKQAAKAKDAKSNQVVSDASFWQGALHTIEESVPGYKQIYIEKSGKITVVPENAIHNRAADYFQYRAEQNTLIKVSVHGDRRDAAYLKGWAYVIHTGNWGGLFGKLITLAAVLIGCSLPVTGYMLYIRKLRRKRRSR